MNFVEKLKDNKFYAAVYYYVFCNNKKTIFKKGDKVVVLSAMDEHLFSKDCVIKTGMIGKIKTIQHRYENQLAEYNQYWINIKK